MVWIQEKTLIKGCDLVRDASTPALSPESFTRYSSCVFRSVRSCNQPHSVRRRGRWIYLVYFFAVLLKQKPQSVIVLFFLCIYQVYSAFSVS